MNLLAVQVPLEIKMSEVYIVMTGLMRKNNSVALHSLQIFVPLDFISGSINIQGKTKLTIHGPTSC